MGSLELVAAQTAMTNLPAQVSSFIGRDRALAEVRALVGGARLVTLIGVGGAGKTRLGLQAAAGLLDGTGDGVWFADLAPLADPDLVPVTVANVLGVRQEPEQPVLDTLVDAVGERSLLLLLDNCEHVIGACAKLAHALLRGCPNLALLATSREPLGIDGEQVYRVPSMGVPAQGADGMAVQTSEAVRLLADRAAAQGVPLAWDEESAQVAARICRRLDGIPLAIELAAARLRVMSAAELEARLDERFDLLTGGSRAALPRQQTLRAMVDWSWDLLTSAERSVLARLSVFAGGFGLAEAEAVAASPEVPGGEVLAHLGGLVNKSLVQFGDAGTDLGRYRLLETIREYASSQLDALGPTAAGPARMAHRDYYLALAEEAEPQLFAAGQAAWLDRLDAELGNLRVAIAFSLTQPDPEPGLRLGAALRVYWLARGHAAEAATALRSLLEAPAAKAPTIARARALAATVSLSQQTGGYAIVESYSEEALAIARTAGDDHLVAELHNEQAWNLLRQGRPDAALSLIEAGLDLARRLQDFRVISLLLSARALSQEYEGNVAGAVSDAAMALQYRRQTGDQRGVGHALGNLGTYELSAGNVDAAREHLRESLANGRAVKDRYGTLATMHNLGLAEYLGGSPGAAQALFAETLDLARRMGMKMNMAYALLGLAMAGQSADDPGWGARMHGAADQALADLQHELEPLETRLADLDRQRLRAALGAEAFDAEYAAGRDLGMAGALATLRYGPQTAAAREPGPGEVAPSLTVLSPRELDVLKLVAQGLSNAEIAKQLVLSDHTVHRHLANILRKLDVSSRAAAAAWGVRTGLV
jgi:predicted ATPase/DNA-binding CsgD family transcriptional regulator